MVEVVPNQTFEDGDLPSMCSELVFFFGFYSLKVLADADYFANLLRLHRPFFGKKEKIRLRLEKFGICLFSGHFSKIRKEAGSSISQRTVPSTSYSRTKQWCTVLPTLFQ